MKFILTKGEAYLNDADVLVRVYDAQCKTDEESQCCGDILFRPKMNRENIQFSAALPRGLVKGIKHHLDNIKGDYIVQISNELPEQIGILTNCSDNFDIRLKQEFPIQVGMK